MASSCPHTSLSIAFLNEFHSHLNSPVVLNGSELSIPKLHAISQKVVSSVSVDSKNLEEAKTNAQYLDKVVRTGKVIYGVNTGFGGSADVRSSDLQEVQRALVRHQNVGFSTKMSPDTTRAVMAVRANSLSRAMSGVRPEVIKLLTAMLNHDIMPEVPLRGSVSASGDLMPTSYIAAAMSGRPDCKVLKSGKPMFGPQALAEAGLEPVTFGAKEALAVVNSSSVAASLGACVLYETNKAVLLTQVAVALSTEALLGRRESFHPTISSVCLAHPGHIEVAGNVWALLDGSKFAITEVEINRADEATLKQDRYALRTSAQWLAAVPETLMESVRRVEIELNCTGDNPIIDHHGDDVLHGGNFQGTSVTVAMDQTRQAVQLCGKLLFAQMSEILNVKMSNGLPPNLSGSDTSLDFGYKAADIAMASYMSELDWLTPPLTNHVLSAEMHNQSVNSLALISARRTKESLDILYMMLVNIMNAQVQAIDLRFLQRKVHHKLKQLFSKYSIKANLVHDSVWPWYEFAFSPERTTKNMMETLDCNTSRKEELVKEMAKEMNKLNEEMGNGVHTDEIASSLGRGSSKLYTFLRREVGIKFYHADRTLDNDLEKIHSAVTSTPIDKVLIDIFDKHVQACQKVPTSHKLEVYSRL